MDLRLSGKRVLITGGSRGIGRAAAEVLAAEGCGLVLVARDAAVLDAAADAIRRTHRVGVETLAAGLSAEAEARRVAAAAGGIDVLVNNAGAIPPGSLLSGPAVLERPRGLDPEHSNRPTWRPDPCCISQWTSSYGQGWPGERAAV